MGLDGRFLRRNRKIQEDYNVGRGNVKIYEYQYGNIHIQTSDQGKKMMIDEKGLYILGIIMTNYSLEQGLQRFGKRHGQLS